ncbi:CaiB/BaiF CoA-transferase family protein [Gordonia hydrophobica]|uniref:CoA transferase n=1 Tax=Gordonia hydrophobica TaxID=40516 RepID=A0ABZ2U348_9ACTN|nr:CoA transferase [Gordonia hydrophobica]MBM7367391.1 crotonobetainyl-CoA:carnitine CoA-transferase CaiB-like acyl-CoA transferase [Gordonia hydrophobica]
MATAPQSAIPADAARPLDTALPLTAVRVVDLTEGMGESTGRFLADLGADVLRVSSDHSTEGPAPAIADALRRANKSVLRLRADAEADRARLREVITCADIVITSEPRAALTSWELDLEALRRSAPHLVWVAVTPFGLTGPYRDRVADEPVLYAMSGVLSRSGAPGEVPLLPPAGLAEGTVAAHAAWAALLAYHRRLDTGLGDTVDVSAYEAMVHGFDPGFGTQGSAAAGRSEDYPRNRPDASNFYPVFDSRDGQVRLCLLAKRPWRSMFEWLGSPAEFADPRYDTIPGRFADADRLHARIGALFAQHTSEQLVTEGVARGIPIGAVSTLGQALAEDHFAESGALIDAEIMPGTTARIPSGYVRIGGRRAGFRSPAQVRSSAPSWSPERATPAQEASSGTPHGTAAPAPLSGVRVLDLGVIVFGAELSRQLADYGADVIKIENTRYPDGLRQSKRGAKIPASVAWGHRNKRSLGIDLRSPEGADLFRRLVADADVVVANFKPGTLAAMGFSAESLARVNPRIIVAESSAFGDVGPWRTRMGYGPLVRAGSGVSALWRYPSRDHLLCDGSTVYPDHIAGHLCATAILAALIDRRRTGRGTAISLAQVDVALNQIGVGLATESLAPGTVGPTGNADPQCAPSGVFACRGDDEWLVVTIRTDEQWAAFAGLASAAVTEAADPCFATSADRLAHRAEVDRVVAAWAATRTPHEAAADLQAVGIPAAPMARLPELLDDEHLLARRSFTTVTHDLLGITLPAVARAAIFGAIADPPARQAPSAGEHTREIGTELLHLTDAEIAALVESDVLQPND